MNVELPLPVLLGVDEASGGSSGVSRRAGSAVEILARVLEDSAAVLEQGAGIDLPDDELHREILLPLLPAMLRDKAIAQHWREQAATGLVARLQAHLEGLTDAPQWVPGDFEIHVTASYLAGPDAKALADTLLSEESLRTLTADLLNQVLAVVWPKLAPAMEEESVVPLGEAIPASMEAGAAVEVQAPGAIAAPITSTGGKSVQPTPYPRVRIKSSFEIARQLARLRKSRFVRRSTSWRQGGSSLRPAGRFVRRGGRQLR